MNGCCTAGLAGREGRGELLCQDVLQVLGQHALLLGGAVHREHDQHRPLGRGAAGKRHIGDGGQRGPALEQGWLQTLLESMEDLRLPVPSVWPVPDVELDAARPGPQRSLDRT